MKELPEELTPELLSLILSGSEIREIKVCAINEIVKDEILPNTTFLNFDFEDDEFIDEGSVNIDTLTRLMKECVWNNDYWQSVSTVKNIDGTWKAYGTSLNLHYAKTEFEAVLKATHWVAKEKGLL